MSKKKSESSEVIESDTAPVVRADQTIQVACSQRGCWIILGTGDPLAPVLCPVCKNPLQEGDITDITKP